MPEAKRPTIGVIVNPAVKRAMADEAWRCRMTQSELALEMILDGLRQRGVEIEIAETEQGRAS